MDKIVKNIKRSNLILLIFIVLLCIVITVQTVSIIYLNSNDNLKIKSNDEIVINADYIVETPVVDLVYHTEAVDIIKVKTDDKEHNNVTFLANVGDLKDIELFTFYFNEHDKGDVIGIIKDKNNKQVQVSVFKNKFDSSVKLNTSDISRLLSTQEILMDTIISNMEFE